MASATRSSTATEWYSLLTLSVVADTVTPVSGASHADQSMPLMPTCSEWNPSAWNLATRTSTRVATRDRRLMDHSCGQVMLHSTPPRTMRAGRTPSFCTSSSNSGSRPGTATTNASRRTLMTDLSLHVPHGRNCRRRLG